METALAILLEFESTALEAVETDRIIDCDPYESIGKLKLIRKIISRIQKEA